MSGGGGMLSTAVLAVLIGTMTAATAQQAVVGSAGGLTVSYAGVPVLTGDSLLLMDENWKAIESAFRNPAQVAREGAVVTTRWSGPLTAATRTVTRSEDGVEIRYEITLQPDPRGRHVELCLGIPAALLDDFPAGGTQGVLRSDQTIVLPTLVGDLTCDLRGSTTPWNLDDLRAVEWAKSFRLRFAPAYDPAAGLSATAVLRITGRPSQRDGFVCLDVAAAGNRGLTDETAEDGQGGWTDQGDNDLRALKPGRHAWLGLPFEIGDRAVILQATGRPAFPVESPRVPIGAALARLYLLHTAAWSAEFRQPIAEYEIRYVDGEVTRLPVRFGVDINDWWGAAEPLEARTAWSADNGHATVGLYLTRFENPRPGIPIQDVRLRSATTAAVPIWLAGTGLRAGAFSAPQLALLDETWRRRVDPPVSTDGWIPAPIAWHDGIVPGSALDVSFLNDPPAGKHGFLTVRDGHFVFAEGDGRPVRFWGTNAALYGPFPAKEDAPGIAACLARQGVNMVRLHLYAVYENTMIAPDGSLDPDALDRFCWFIAKLAEVGIYTYMDLNDGMFYDRLVGRKLPADNKALKLASLFDTELIAAQQKLARALFGHTNPYTGRRLCDDPAIALYELTNENSLTMAWGTLKERLPAPYYEELEGLWHAWLTERGLPVRGLPDSLGTGDDESRRFGAELQARYYHTMRDCLREIGVKAPICGTNITFTLGDLWASRDLDYTNDHAYADHPNVSVRPMTYSNLPTVSAPASSLRMIPSFARAKLWDKPLVASEWNYCFPNDYRCEGLPQMSAYAAYQDWDGLLFYCATGSFDAGRWSRFHENPAILVHSQQTDPATWGLSQLCALLFRRGDVRVGQRVVRLTHGPTALWGNQSLLGSLSFLPAVARVEAELTPDDRPAPLTIDPQASPEERYTAVLAALGDTRSTSRRIVSDTGELARDAEEGIFTVDTPATQIATGYLSKTAEIRLTHLRIACATRFATIAAGSLDGRPLSESARILLAAVANARNADTKCDGKRLESMGAAPVLAEPVTATLTLAAENPGGIRVYALNSLTGERHQEVPATAQGDSLTFAIGPAHAAIYYELTRP